MPRLTARIICGLSQESRQQKRLQPLPIFNTMWGLKPKPSHCSLRCSGQGATSQIHQQPHTFWRLSWRLARLASSALSC